MVVVDIATNEYEASTYSVHHGDELFKVWVGGVVYLAKPHVADADVEWVVVADATWNCFVHNVGY